MSWTWSERLAATSLVSFAALASGSVLGPGCASAPSGDADAAVDAGDASLDTGGTGDVSADGGLPFDVGSDGRGDVGTFEASVPPDAGPLPEPACSADGGSDAAGDGDAEAGRDPCPLPVSTCVDHWLVTYLNGVCVDGRCEFVRVIKDCRDEGGSGCFAFSEGARCTFPVGK